MDFLEYQRLAMRTRGQYSTNCQYYNCAGEECTPAHKTDKKLSQLNACALGLSGEAGEFTDLVKKILFHNKPITFEVLDKLQKELGDVMWYIAGACDALNFHMDEVALENIAKLKKRYPEGFDYEASEKRVDLNVKL